MIDVRPAQARDLPVLVGTFGDEAFLSDRWRRQIQGNGVLLTAWSGTQIGGICYLWEEPVEEPTLRARMPGVPHVNRLEVLPQLRRRGIGTRLLRALEDLAAQRGHATLALGVAVQNSGARRFYEHLGYRPWRHEPLVWRWHDERGRLQEETVQVLTTPLGPRAPAQPVTRRAGVVPRPG